MSQDIYNLQWTVICYLAQLLSENNIEYQFEASTSVFIHGIDFVMEDIDLIILRQYQDQVEVLLAEYPSTETLLYQDSMEYRYVTIQGQKVHLMYPYYKTDCIEETRDIIHDGVSVHTKTMEFYRRYINKDHPLCKQIDEMIGFLDEQNSEIEGYDEALVRKMIERVTVYENKFEVEFKAGVKLDIDRKL